MALNVWTRVNGVVTGSGNFSGGIEWKIDSQTSTTSTVTVRMWLSRPNTTWNSYNLNDNTSYIEYDNTNKLNQTTRFDMRNATAGVRYYVGLDTSVFPKGSYRTFTVTHNPDGTRTLPIKAYLYGGTTGFGSLLTTTEVVLDPIPRTCTNVTSFNISKNPASSTDTITLTWDGATTSVGSTIDYYMLYARVHNGTAWGAYTLLANVTPKTYIHNLTGLSHGNKVQYKIITHNSYGSVSSGIEISEVLDIVNIVTTVEGRQSWAILKDKDSSYRVGFFDSATIKLFRSKYIEQIVPSAEATISKYVPVSTKLDGALYTIATSDDPTRAYNSVTDTYGNFYLPNGFKLTRLKMKKTATPQETASNNPNFGNALITKEDVIVKDPSITESVAVGYNMLKANPYTFPNTVGATEAKGIVPYAIGSPLGNIKFNMNVGEKIRFNFVYGYEAGQAYKVKWEYLKDGDTTFTVLQDFTAITTLGSLVYKDITVVDAAFTIRVTIRKNDLASTDQQIPGFFVTGDNVSVIDNPVFDLTTATGMFSFSGMLGLYGVRSAENTIFFSDIGNPGYFPFPNNVEDFDGEVLKVVNYLDMLLIVTNKSFYLISGAGTVANLVKKKILDNLDITQIDAENIRVIKDQLFFKSGSIYYVLKPNSYSSDGTDLRNYEISTPITPLIADIRHSTKLLLMMMYGYDIEDSDVLLIDETIQILDGKLYLMFPVHVTVDNVIKTFTPTFIYDPLTRIWMTHLYSTADIHSIIYSFKEESNVLTYIHPYELNSKSYIQLVQAVKGSKVYKDSITKNQIVNSETNVQLIDTGIASLNNSLFKRLRELQITVNNNSQDKLSFYISVFADGRNVVDTTTYGIEHIIDTESDDYGMIYTTEYDAANALVAHIYSSTILDVWELDFSKFPTTSLVRAHLKLRGTGRFISAIIINKDEKEYELSNILWAYRVKSGR